MRKVTDEAGAEIACYLGSYCVEQGDEVKL
jgi:hypothetical protein